MKAIDIRPDVHGIKGTRCAEHRLEQEARGGPFCACTPPAGRPALASAARKGRRDLKTMPITPGEWSLPHFADPATKCDCGYMFAVEGEATIATVHHAKYGMDKDSEHPPMDEAIANAHLLRAAPELLAALNRLYEETADYISINHLGDIHHNQAMKDARAAIALAEPKP